MTVALALLLDAGLVATLLARSRGPIDVPRLLLVLAWGLLFVLVQGALVALGWRRFFLSVHLMHGFLFLVAPAFGLLVALGRPWRARHGARALGATGALILAAVGIDSSLIEPSRLVTERAIVPVAPGRAGRAELRIGVLADLQCDRITEHERRAVAQLMAERPDLILLPGDVAQPEGEAAFRALLPELRTLLADLSAPLGVYCVLGDIDTADGLTELLEGTGVRLLRNESVELAWRDRRITLAGVARLPDDPEGRALLGRLSAAERGRSAPAAGPQARLVAAASAGRPHRSRRGGAHARRPGAACPSSGRCSRSARSRARWRAAGCSCSAARRST
jgi:hypothetical protein